MSHNHTSHGQIQMEASSNKHFILVHGLCHGAWCWYKVVPMLRSAGHRVTALDLAASGVHPARMDEVPSFEDYSLPLLEAVAAAPLDGERLVLVGHSLGGLSLALAMERFPRKVAAAVFLAASMPCAGRHIGITFEEFMRRIKPDFFMDSKRMVLNTNQGPRTAVLLGPKLMAAKLYDQSSTEDLVLATMLVRPGSQFMDDPIMKDEALLTDGNYGSVKRVFVIAMADTSSSEEAQRWMVDLSPGAEVEEIAGADHMAMCSKPRELCDILLRIANKPCGNIATKPNKGRHFIAKTQEMESSSSSESKHFILVHGLGHGAWCWYKVATLLDAAGHRVTALDLAASGTHQARVDEVHSFEDYSRPLLDAVAAAPAGERLVLVGHSHGGLSLALAMERFPVKVAAAVFVAAGMPCVGKHMGFTIEEFMRRNASEGLLMDCKMLAINNNQGPGVAILMGPDFLAHKYYQQSPAEDLILAKMLVRPGNQFVDDPIMKDGKLLTDGNYGSVKKVYVVAKADGSSTEEMQRWMVALSPGTEVEQIVGADHAVMSSKPRELCDVLVKIANKYG